MRPRQHGIEQRGGSIPRISARSSARIIAVSRNSIQRNREQGKPIEPTTVANEVIQKYPNYRHLRKAHRGHGGSDGRSDELCGDSSPFQTIKTTKR
jgi:hypothetical protein